MQNGGNGHETSNYIFNVQLNGSNSAEGREGARQQLIQRSVLFFYLDTIPPLQIVFLSCSCRWGYLPKWRQVVLNGIDILLCRYVNVST